jgi:hypothetical protein
LFGSGNVAAENNYATWLNFLDQVTRIVIQLCSWETDEEELSDLVFERK